MSGTYKCEDNMAYQAGFPLDKFYAVQSSCPPEDDPTPCVQLDGYEAGWLRKALPFTEHDLVSVHNEWVGHVLQMLENDASAKSSYDAMKLMTTQLHTSIERYGLYSGIHNA